ncbi:MAG: CRTAC1 family protein, partial [Planctomycetota bacterium]
MRRLRTLVPGLLVLVATDAYSQEPAALRDPDRGLDPELRERLARVDPARDERWPLERVAARIEAHLAMLSKLWSAGELEQGLAGAAWIAGELRVRALDGRGASEQEQRGAWSFARSAADGEGDQAPFAAALSAWRRAFGGAARLDTELFALEAREGDFLGEIRLVASGMEGGARARDEVTWNTRWRERSGGELALVALAAGALERVTLSGHPRGLFEDVSASFFADDGFHAREVAPGLDAWRRVVPAPLEPGLLGHHGLALGDVDGDGREDLYWCRPGGLPNRLFLHQPDDRVREVSAAFGVDLLDYSSSALLLELDGDGDLDLVVATATGLVFFANDGGRRFTLARRLERSLATSLAAADHDGDGDLDLYCCSYVSPYEASGTPVPYHDANNGEANVLLRNDGDFELVDVTAAVGLDANNRRFSLAASWEDYDQDGDADLYVANDFGLKNLYRNDGGRFVDVAGELDALDVSAGMGVSWGDVDGDGWMDLYATNLHSPAGSRLTGGAARPGSSAENARAYREHARGNTLLMSGRGAPFRDVSEASGTFRGRWGWGALFVDFDADGWLDLYAPNGFVTGERETDLDSFFWRQVVLRSPDGPGAPEGEYDLGWRAVRRLSRQGWSWNGHERNAAFLNLGAERFADVGSLTALDQADDARAAVRVDWDADGDEDLIVANRSAPMLRVLRNGQTGAGWIAFELDGAGRTAIGARVTVTTSGGRPLVRAARCGEGYLAQSSARLEFGLAHEQVQRVSVRWPGGVEEDFGAPGAGARYRLARGSGRAAALAPRAVASALAPASSSLAPAQLGARLVLPEPLALPRLALETSDARAVALFGITPQGPSGTGKPLLIVLWSSEVPASRALLAALSARAGDLAGLQVLALGVA